jgi:hypothetical protein
MIIILIQPPIILDNSLIDLTQDPKTKIILVEISTEEEIMKENMKEEGKISLSYYNLNLYLDQDHSKIKNTIMGEIITIEDREGVFPHLKKEVPIKEIITSYNKKDLILKNLISNRFHMILINIALNLKISFLIKEEICLFKPFNHSNLEIKNNKTDFLITEIMLKNI